MKKSLVMGLLMASSAMVANTSYAASAACDSPSNCNTVHAAAAPKISSLADLSMSLALNQDQNLAMYSLVQQQMPNVTESQKKLEAAQSLLRNMALNKQFDQTVADMLAETIAKNSANLALLQAQREYEILLMLTPEQAQKYAQLMQ